ncbi:Hypothetical protein CINCED_3A004854 [Cinara cedri]|uniref:Uncharacterized protein n=1 Tax=Cinara cedri TaxID=506608 RepID=A0A5E4MQY8_9HEMI|nr:Hypothetical protein CINCED_3A004854 [Cinara cedri]
MIYQTAEPELTEPKLEKIRLIVKDLKNFKALEEDEINPELLKLAGKDFATVIHLILKNIWNKECMLKELEFRDYMHNLQKRRYEESNKLSWNLAIGHRI